MIEIKVLTKNKFRAFNNTEYRRKLARDFWLMHWTDEGAGLYCSVDIDSTQGYSEQSIWAWISEPFFQIYRDEI